MNSAVAGIDNRLYVLTSRQTSCDYHVLLGEVPFEYAACLSRVGFRVELG